MKGFLASVWTALLAAGLVVAAASCSKGGPPAELENAGPLIKDYVLVSGGLHDVAVEIGSETTDGPSPPSATATLGRLGTTAARILTTVEPTGNAGTEAVTVAVAEASPGMVRNLVLAAGGRAIGPDRVALAPPGLVAVSVAPLSADQRRSLRERVGSNDQERRALAWDQLRSIMLRDIEFLSYTALLAEPAAQARLAPRMTPADLPDQLDEEWNLPVSSLEEWRSALFDADGRVVIPSSYDPIGYPLFTTWAKVVNPSLYDKVTELTNVAARPLLAVSYPS